MRRGHSQAKRLCALFFSCKTLIRPYAKPLCWPYASYVGLIQNPYAMVPFFGETLMRFMQAGARRESVVKKNVMRFFFQLRYGSVERWKSQNCDMPSDHLTRWEPCHNAQYQWTEKDLLGISVVLAAQCTVTFVDGSQAKDLSNYPMTPIQFGFFFHFDTTLPLLRTLQVGTPGINLSNTPRNVRLQKMSPQEWSHASAYILHPAASILNVYQIDGESYTVVSHASTAAFGSVDQPPVFAVFGVSSDWILYSVKVSLHYSGKARNSYSHTYCIDHI